MNKNVKIYLLIGIVLLIGISFILADTNIRQNVHIFGFLNATNSTSVNLISETEFSGNISLIGNLNISFNGQGRIFDNGSCLLLERGNNEIAICS